MGHRRSRSRWTTAAPRRGCLGEGPVPRAVRDTSAWIMDRECGGNEREWTEQCMARWSHDMLSESPRPEGVPSPWEYIHSFHSAPFPARRPFTASPHSLITQSRCPDAYCSRHPPAHRWSTVCTVNLRSSRRTMRSRRTLPGSRRTRKSIVVTASVSAVLFAAVPTLHHFDSPMQHTS